MQRIALLALVAFLFINPSAWAAKVVLKNGSVFDGTLVRKDASSVTLQVSLGEITFQRKDIVRLEGTEFDDERKAAEAPRPSREAEAPQAEPRAEERSAPAQEPETASVSERPTPEPRFERAREEAIPRPAPVPAAIAEGEEAGSAPPEATDETAGPHAPGSPADFVKELKRALGRPDATWGMGFLLGILLVYVFVSFALATLVTWGLSHMMSSVSDPSLVNALKVTSIQWGAALVLLFAFGAFLAVMGAGSDPQQMVAAAGTACCALPVFLLAMVAVNIGVVAKVFQLGAGASFVFVIGQGIGGWLVDAVMRHALVGALVGK